MVDYIERAQEALTTHKFTSTQVPELILSILKDEKWKHRDPSQKRLAAKEFEFFPEFVEAARPWGLQTEFKEIEHLCKGFIDVELALSNSKLKEGITINDEKLKKIRKSDRQKCLEQLKELKPDLFNKVEKNELSVYQAMIEGGLRKQRAKIKKSPEGFADYIRQNFSSKQKEQLIKLLKENT